MYFLEINLYLHQTLYLVSPTIWSSKMLIFVTIKFFYQVKMLVFYNVQTTYLTYVGKKNDSHNK